MVAAGNDGSHHPAKTDASPNCSAGASFGASGTIVFRRVASLCRQGGGRSLQADGLSMPAEAVGSLGGLASNPHFPAFNLNLETSLLEPRSCLHIGSTKMASNAVVFLAGVGTTFAVLTAGFSGGLVFTKAAFEDRPAPTRADPGPAPRVRVILPGQFFHNI